MPIEARTPYQRLIDAGVLNETTHEKLKEQFLALDPVALGEQIDQILDQLTKLADRPAAR